MRRLLFIVTVASALAFGCAGEGGGGRPSTAGSGATTERAPEAQPPPSPAAITAAEAAALVGRGEAVLVDVREERELTRGMAAPAVWIPTSEIGRDGPAWRSFVEAQPRDRMLIFYCAVGGRSQYAATQLAQQGYRTANLGGFSEWVNAGLPVKIPEHPEIGR